MTRILLALLSLAGIAAGFAETSSLKREQEVVFFPAMAHLSDGGKAWEIQFQGCIFESDSRWLALAVLRGALGLEHVKLTTAENKTLADRARLFMLDHKEGRTMAVRVGDRVVKLKKSADNGFFSVSVQVSIAEAEQLRNAGGGFHAVLKDNDKRSFGGEVEFFEDSGLTVISDIDDTIKITQVRDRKATLRNTFLEPFRPVQGMAEAYREWSQKCGAQFCYVSASPWQLYTPLIEFTRSNGFPSGVFFLKDFQWTDKTVFGLFESPGKYKPRVIEPMLKQFPKRKFVLVGDSGESDPEVYSALARKYPEQIACILIRDVTGETGEAERYRRAFEGLPSKLWKVFHDGSEIKDAIPSSMKEINAKTGPH